MHVQVLGEIGQVQPGRGGLSATKATTTTTTAVVVIPFSARQHERPGGRSCGLGASWHHPGTVGRGAGRDVAQVPQIVIGRRYRVVHDLLVIRRRLVVIDEESAARRGPFGGGGGGG